MVINAHSALLYAAQAAEAAQKEEALKHRAWVMGLVEGYMQGMRIGP